MTEKDRMPKNHHASWTIRDLQYLEQYYGSMPVADISVHLGRTPGAVRLMADKLGCRTEKHPWSSAEMDILRVFYRVGVSALTLQQLLPGRSISAIFTMAEKMGVVSGRFWSKEEVSLLQKHYPDKGVAVKEQLPGRSVMSIRKMARRLGLKKRAEGTGGYRTWSEEELRRLEKHSHLSARVVQATLFPDRTRYAVEKARERLKKKTNG